uniref:Uncharacterized protein n=1 Tax=Arundo donax TaxID=35708 RepID=A0A0A9H186_ARUDO
MSCQDIFFSKLLCVVISSLHIQYCFEVSGMLKVYCICNVNICAASCYSLHKLATVTVCAVLLIY